MWRKSFISTGSTENGTPLYMRNWLSSENPHRNQEISGVIDIKMENISCTRKFIPFKMYAWSANSRQIDADHNATAQFHFTPHSDQREAKAARFAGWGANQVPKNGFNDDLSLHPDAVNSNSSRHRMIEAGAGLSSY
jgi:hypothetical protein